jgi:CheY-like chemotaxis protein
MKVLVVDDDAGIRRLLVSLLKEHFDCWTTEVNDGLEALAAIRKAPPQLVLLDIGLPVMDGIEVLEALRAEPAYRLLPVVVVSGIADTASVRRAVTLGAMDFLVKPIRLLEAEGRLRRVFDSLRRRRTLGPAAPGAPPADGTDGKRVRLLVIDRDLNFRQMVSGLLEGEVTLLVAEHGSDGLLGYVESQPHVVSVGEGLSLPNERLLARKIRALDTSRRSRLYLCAERDELSGEDTSLFDGVLRRSYVPARLRAEFTRVLMDHERVHAPLRRLLREELEPEIVTAVRQALGFATMHDIAILPQSEATAIVRDVGRYVDLKVVGEERVLRAAIAGSRADVEHLAALMVGAPTTVEDGAGDALGELLNTIAGRLSQSFDASGVRMVMGTPHDMAGTESLTPDVVLPFAAADGERLVLTVTVAGGASEAVVA